MSTSLAGSHERRLPASDGTEVANGAEVARRGGRPPSGPSGYRPHLDGLRTVAVYLVVLFHADIGRWSGGFIGVDVFFVLSGYLVTQVLMRDLTAHGRVLFGRFYARRFRRLLPAAALALLGTAVAYSWVNSPAEVAGAIDGFRASFLYVANWFFIRESADYFAAGQAESPVLHFWSLAVEEQFYLAWPLLLAGLAWLFYRAGSRSWALVRAVVALAAAASLAWAWHLSGSSLDRAYYGTDARAYQLLAGALLAMTPSLITRLPRLDRLAPPVALAALGGLVFVSTDLIDATPVTRGAVATVLAIVLLASLERRGGAARSVLGWKPMVELGRISYGTYLWHWPVIVIFGRLGDFSPWQVALTSAVVASGLAALSAVLVELPVRGSDRLDRVPRLVVVGGLTVSILLALVVVRPVSEMSGGNGTRATVVAAGDGGSGLTPLPADFDEKTIQEEGFAVDLGCDHNVGEVCTLVEGDGPHVVLIGDSNAVMLAGALRDVAEAEGLTFTSATSIGCAWQDGYFYDSHPDKRETCEAIHERVYGAVLDEIRPDVVVAVGVREWSTFTNPEFSGADQERTLRSATETSVDRIVSSGARLVVIEPIPRGPRDPNPLHCLGRALYQEECRFSSPTEPYWFERDLRELDRANVGMWSVDLDPVICPALPTCEAIADDVVVHWDDAHLTRRYGLTLAGELAEVLRSRQLIGP